MILVMRAVYKRLKMQSNEQNKKMEHFLVVAKLKEMNIGIHYPDRLHLNIYLLVPLLYIVQKTC